MTTKITNDNVLNVDASKVTNLASSFDDNDIVNDLSTLALRQASNENKVAYNTNSMYVDVFQDSTGITGLTNAARDSSEFMRAFGTTSVPFSGGTDFTGASTYGLIQLSAEGSPVNGGHTGSFAGDTIMTENVSTHNGATCARAFSTAGDFTIRIYALNSSGNRHATGYSGYSACMIPDDTYARTNASSDLFKVPGSDAVNNLGFPFANPTQWEGGLLNNAYAVAQGVSGFSNFANAHSTFGGAQQNFNCNGNGFAANGYKNDGAVNGYGAYACYTSSNNELLMGVLSSPSDSTAIHGSAAIAVLNLPSDGTVVFLAGDANGSPNQSSGLRKYSMTYNGHAGTLTDSTYDTFPAGSTVTEALVAAGSFTSNNVTAPSSISSMGAIITYQDFSGTNALNTDIIMKLSADGGVTYSTATLTAMTDFSTGIKMAKVNDLSVTAGTSLKYKIEFANQAVGTKEARIRGVSLQY